MSFYECQELSMLSPEFSAEFPIIVGVLFTEYARSTMEKKFSSCYGKVVLLTGRSLAGYTSTFHGGAFTARK